MNHGTATARRAGCKCDICRAYATKCKKLWRHRTKPVRTNGGEVPTIPSRVPIEPIRAHVAALMASGWLQRDIAYEIGASPSSLANTLHRRKATTRDRAARIMSLRPLEPVDCDDVLVDRFIAGEAQWTQLTREERIEAARRMDRRGWSRADIARLTHLRSETLYGEAWVA